LSFLASSFTLPAFPALAWDAFRARKQAGAFISKYQKMPGTVQTENKLLPRKDLPVLTLATY